MSEPFPPPLEELQETFDFFEEWDERYEYLIELGRELPPMPDGTQTDENKVDGCMSTVWLIVQKAEDGGDNLRIMANSDSLIVKGLIVVLTSAFANKNPEEILKFDIEEVFKNFGLHQHLSPNRRNGLFSMVKRVKELAVHL